MSETSDMAERIEAQLQRDRESTNAEDAWCGYVRSVANWVSDWQDNVIRDLFNGHSVPDEVALRLAIKALGEAEGKDFILRNMVESLKDGQPLSDVVKRYNKQGITNITVPPQQVAAPTTPSKDDQSQYSWLARIRRGLGNFCLTLIEFIGELLVKLADKIPIGVVEPIVGFTGFKPSLSFKFNYEKMKDKNLTFGDIIKAFREAN